MKGLIACVCVVGAALTLSSAVAPTVIADENGEVHTWSSSSSAHVPPDETVRYVDTQEAAVPMAAQGTRIYLVNDDPAYDLSGAGDHWFLVGDGTAFREDSWRSQAAFARTGVPHEVIPISAEYRQDWLAVAAGDRPVRTFTAPRSVMDTGAMAGVATNAGYVNSAPGYDRDEHTASRHVDTFRPVHHPRRRAYVHRRVHSAQLSAYRRHHRRQRAAAAQYSASTTEREDEPEMTTVSNEQAVATAEASVEIERDQMGHELFQIGTSWYMTDKGDWYRAESWRGPFVHVKKGRVPREVRMSAEHPSRMDMD